MKFGIVSPNNPSGMSPMELARELEERGFDSLWVGEHTHIPVPSETSTSPLASYQAAPQSLAHKFSALIALTAAAAVTSRIRLGTSICQVLEHDLIDLAKQVASLDVLSGGRLDFGIGVGWNEQELFNHRPEIPFKKRYSAVRERVAALRTIWRDDICEFEGQWDRLTPSWVFPKPINRSVPIFMGGEGPLAREHAASYADHWLPHERAMTEEELWDENGRPKIAHHIEAFQEELAKQGRDRREMNITMLILVCPPSDKLIEAYSNLGIDRLIFTAPGGSSETARDEMLKAMDRVQPLLAKFPD